MQQKEDSEELLNILLPFAEGQLKKRRGFYPFGAVMLNSGELKLTEIGFDGSAEELIAALTAEHKATADRGEIKASGIAWDGRITPPDGEKTDAVLVSLEHRERYSVVIGEPYKLGFWKKPKFGEIVALEGEHKVFR